MRARTFSTVIGIAAVLAVAPLAAQQDYSDVEITTITVAPGIFMLTGAGGNIGVSVGRDGVFVIDDQFAPLSEKIMTALEGLSDQPVSYVLNTHWHGDHTGGNENFGKAGAVIVAHDNVRTRMSTDQFMKAFGNEVPASPVSALPVVTFSDDITFHFNGETISVTHAPAAHTDGDAMVFFEGENVMHTGDTFFNGSFPFIDESSGGTLAGAIAAAELALELSNEDTQIIPGHGPLATRADLQRHHTMLGKVQTEMQAQLDAGRSREEVIAANPLGNLDESWGGGFLKTDQFTGIVYDVMSAQ